MATFKYASWTFGQVEALINSLGGEETAKKILARSVKVVIEEIKETVLELVGMVTIGATEAAFVAGERFIRDTGKDATVKISFLGDNFQAWFLGKNEEPIGEQTLRYHQLRKASVDAPIIAELGGEAKAETTLAEVYALIAKQASGEKGALLNNGWWNIFYVRDTCGVLRAVSVGWGGGGWDVGASSIEGPDGWAAGNRVFSRNSCAQAL